MHFPVVSTLIAAAAVVSVGAAPATDGTCGINDQQRAINVTLADGLLRFRGTGCPGYDWTSQSTPNQAKATCNDVKLPSTPRIRNSGANIYVGIYKDKAKTIANDDVSLGPIGISVNGISLYGNSDAEMEDAYESESHTFDTCGGHPDMKGNYHYHAEVEDGCVYTTVAGQHSPLFGMMYDGVPIYGPLGDGGIAPTDLDECNGHTDSTHSFYHYHIQPNMQYPYLVNCLRGCLADGGATIVGVKNTPCTSYTEHDVSSVHQELAEMSDPDYKCIGSAHTTAVLTWWGSIGAVALAFSLAM